MERNVIKVFNDDIDQFLINNDPKKYDIIYVKNPDKNKIYQVTNLDIRGSLKRDYLFDLMLNIKYTKNIQAKEAYDVGFFMLGNHDYVFEFIESCDIVIVNDLSLKRKILNLDRRSIKYTTEFFEKIIL